VAHDPWHNQTMANLVSDISREHRHLSAAHDGPPKPPPATQSRALGRTDHWAWRAGVEYSHVPRAVADRQNARLSTLRAQALGPAGQRRDVAIKVTDTLDPRRSAAAVHEQRRAQEESFAAGRRLPREEPPRPMAPFATAGNAWLPPGYRPGPRGGATLPRDRTLGPREESVLRAEVQAAREAAAAHVTAGDGDGDRVRELKRLMREGHLRDMLATTYGLREELGRLEGEGRGPVRDARREAPWAGPGVGKVNEAAPGADPGEMLAAGAVLRPLKRYGPRHAEQWRPGPRHALVNASGWDPITGAELTWRAGLPGQHKP